MPWRLGLVLAEQKSCALGHEQESSNFSFDLDKISQLFQVGTETLGDFPGGIVLKSKAAYFGSFGRGFFVIGLILIVLRFVTVAVCSSGKGPQPHGREARIFLETCCISTSENLCQRFSGNGGPDVFEVFFERHLLATRLLHAGVAGEDFQCRTKASEDGVSSNHAFSSQTWHPFVNAFGKFRKHVTPVTDVADTKRAVRILAGTADKVDRGGKDSRVYCSKSRSLLGINRPRRRDGPSCIHHCL